MDSGKLLQATKVSHQKQEKQKKLSDDAATNEDHGAFVLRNDVAWLDNVKYDGQQKTAVLTNVSHLGREKQKKSSDNASTNGNLSASFFRGDVVWPDNAKNDG